MAISTSDNNFAITSPQSPSITGTWSRLKMNIALDIEGVLANEKAPLIDAGTFMEEYPSCWDMASSEQFQAYMGASDAMWRHQPERIPAYSDDLSHLTSRMLEHYNMDIVTSRCHVDNQVEKWLDRHNISYDNLIFNDRNISKTERGYDLYIDDNPTMHGFCTLFLVDQPWNRSLNVEKLNRNYLMYPEDGVTYRSPSASNALNYLIELAER